MKEYVIALEVAEHDVSKMVEAMDGNLERGGNDWNVILRTYREGRLSLDELAGEIKYTLASPVELKSGGTLSELTFREPTNADLEYINKGQAVRASSDGTYSLDMSDIFVKTSRMLTKMCSVPLGVSERIMRRDMLVLNVISNFFG